MSSTRYPLWLSPRSLLLAFVCAASAWGADPILLVDDSSITTYKAGAASPVQNVWPRVEQRGAQIDGSQRAGSVFGWALAGNPMADGWSGQRSLSGVDLALGTYNPTDIDLSLPSAGVRWTIGRSYNARQYNAGGSSDHQSDGYQGKNWFQLSQPEIRVFDNDSNPGTNEAADMVYIVYGADRFLEFRRYTYGVGPTIDPDEYRGVNGAAGAVLYVAGSPDTYVYYDQHGTRTYFFGGDTASNKADWQLWKIVDPAGNTAYVGDASVAADAVTNGFDAGGRITTAYDPAGRRYTYTYSTVGGVTRLTEVKAEINPGGGGWVNVGEVDYGYYSADGDTYGDNGCLKTVTVTTPLTDGGISLVKTKYYRYWEGAYNGTTNRGHQYAIQYVVDFEGYRAADWAGDSTFDDDVAGMSESSLKPYAAAYFEYDSSRRVDKFWMNGQCGCSGASNGQFEITYGTSGAFSGNSSYDEEWYARAVVERPDGSYVTQYFDETGQALSRVVSSSDPSGGGSPTHWAWNVSRKNSSAKGVVETIYSPENLDTYTHSTGSYGTPKPSEGQITASVLNNTATDVLLAFNSSPQAKAGTGGSATHINERSLSSEGKAIGSFIIDRPIVTVSKAYKTAGASDDTSYSRTWWTSDASLMPKVLTTTLPAVAVASNGSGSANASKQYLRKDGTSAFTEDASGVFTYTQFTNGQLVKRIQDAQTNHGSDLASGDDPNSDFGVTESGTGNRLITAYTYDNQGRLDTTTLPDGRVTKNYYTRLGDRRLLTISIPKVSGGTFYGPCSFSVTNLAGKVEEQGTIALSGGTSASALSGWIDENDANIKAALDVGSVARLSTSIYDEGGSELQESRMYFNIPSSLPGSDGTDYDATFYGYDPMGRRWRTKQPTGTIERSVFDANGRMTERWTGTNDYSFSGGEGSGPDNMVKVEALTYSLNGNVETRTQYVQDSTTDQRITTYGHDYRGRLVLQVNPQAPHTLHKYDNLGRTIGTAQYSSSSGLDVSDDPTSLDTNRLSLSETAYDEMGRVWKTTRHKIDQADGSSDDTLLSYNWYDAEGRLIKTQGEQHAKTFFDRLGRATHRFTLGETDDAAAGASGTLAAADDVSGDIVLEETQTSYETATGNVLMRAVISRFQDDKGGGETTGALDTNADADSLLFTAANIEGRIQITAMWYDSLNRLTDTVNYGTYGGSNFDRDGLSIPARSDTALVTTNTYNDDGSVKEVTDPRGIIARTLYDAAGRKSAVISNYVNGTPSSATGDDDTFVRYVYTDGLKTAEWVDLDGDGVTDTDDQVTLYYYGVTKGTGAGDSKIAAGHLLYRVAYPDSVNSADTVTYAYNAQGQQKYMLDQAGNVIETSYDTAGRPTHRRVTTIDGDFDSAVLRISTAYDSLGRTTTVTQYDNATVGSGSVVNEVLFRYDDWGNVKDFEQDRDSAVRGSGSVNSYMTTNVWEKAGSTYSAGPPVVPETRYTLRRSENRLSHVANAGFPATPTATTLASVTYEYLSTSDRFDDAASRVTNVKLSSTVLATYEYLGAGRVVGTDLPQIEVMSNLGTGSGVYPDLDRFNRLTTSKWTKDLGTDRDFYDVDIAWDRGSNITSTTDNVWPGRNVSFTIDGLSRVTRAYESDGVTASRDEQWTLTQTGNWDRRKLDLNGDADFTDTDELDDTGAFNKANEWQTRDTDSNASVNYTLTHDEAGNLTDDGKDYKFVYDAFGRLRKIKNQSSVLISEYTYNGLGYRVGWHYDVDADSDVDSNDVWFYFAYDDAWRIVGTFRSSDTNAKELFVSHMAGANGRGGSSALDATILRDRDANTSWGSATDGTREERAYYCQNWRGDVVSMLKHSSGTACQVFETVRYSSYGVPFGITPGDIEGDGDVDTDDNTNWPGSYQVRCDYDLDGDMDITDENYTITNSGRTLGPGTLSHSSVGNRKGYCGYEHDGVIDTIAHVRHRVLLSELGRWSRRDPVGYLDGMSIYQYSQSGSLAKIDPTGLSTNSTGPNRPREPDIGPKAQAQCMQNEDNTNPVQTCQGQNVCGSCSERSMTMECAAQTIGILSITTTGVGCPTLSNEDARNIVHNSCNSGAFDTPWGQANYCTGSCVCDLGDPNTPPSVSHETFSKCQAYSTNEGQCTVQICFAAGRTRTYRPGSCNVYGQQPESPR